MEMNARSLNLSDAFRLAGVISKYVDLDKLDPQADPIDFISSVVEKISPEEYIHCVALLTKTDEEHIKQEIALNILTAFIEGLKQNRIITLLSFYKSLVSK